MKKYLKVIIPIVIVLILAALVIYRFSRKSNLNSFQRKASLVKVEKPIRELVVQQLQYNGDVSAIQQANIFPKVSGNIEKIYVDIGSNVKKNQLLAMIDTTELHQQVQQTAASFQNARLSFERNKKLLEQDLVSKEDLDNAETSMKIAQANYETAMTQLCYACIKAPFDGFITSRFLDQGALVEPGSMVIFTLMDIESVKVVINVLEKDTPLIPLLKKAFIVADALPNRTFEGHISRYSQAIDLSTRTMPVEIVVVNKDYSLKPGMFATVNIIVTEHPDAITVPTQAVLKDEKGNYVFIVENKKAKRVSVETGLEQNFRLEIINGLSGTENVVTTGQEFVKDGGPVTMQR